MVVEELITDSNQDIMRETDKKNNLIKPITHEDVVRLEDKLCPRTYICATDSRFNYTFCKASKLTRRLLWNYREIHLGTTTNQEEYQE